MANGYLKRTRLGRAEEKAAQRTYNNKGQLVDPNNPSIVLKKGQIQKGHKYGYEERAMKRCAERCKMSQKDYDAMCRQFSYKTLQLEDAKSNMSHRYECRDTRVQNHNCMKIIREFKNQNSKNSQLPSAERNGKTFSSQKSFADRAKADPNFGYRVSHDQNGRTTITMGKQMSGKIQAMREGKTGQNGKNSTSGRSISGARTTIGKTTGAGKSTSAGGKGGSMGGKSAGAGSSGGGKGGSSGGGKGGSSGGGKGGSSGGGKGGSSGGGSGGGKGGSSGGGKGR